MAILGTPYRIAYESKNRSTGLVGITATVKKPNGAIIGPLAMAEFSETVLKGLYFVDLITLTTDPIGEWIGSIASPNENAHSAGLRISYRSPPVMQDGDMVFQFSNVARATVKTETLRGVVSETQETLVAKLSENDNPIANINDPATIDSSVDDLQVVIAKINDPEIIGDC